MAELTAFTGFTPQTVKFFKALAVNNSKTWFEQNRPVFVQHVLTPAQAFVVEMGKRLEKIAPEVVAIPKIDKTIFRLHRDVRFSKDKSPYKTHLGMFFWEGQGKKLENPGFYVHFDSEKLLVAAGMHIFPKPHLQEFRESVVHPEYGPALVKALEAVRKHRGFQTEKPHYKKIPRGFDPGHTNAELLKFQGLGVMFETEIPPELFTEQFVDYVYKKFEKMAPIHYWLREMNSRVKR